MQFKTILKLYTYRKTETCYVCGGTGADDGEICASCGGSGKITL